MLSLREHQQNAIKKFENYYYNELNTRGILSMCCGSGKTFTFYNIMKKCINDYNEDLFIYTTSRILLVKGIVKDLIQWSYHDNLNIDILIKVSDFNIKDYFKELENDKKLLNDKNYKDYLDKIRDKNIKLLGDTTDIIDTFKLRYINDKKKIIVITTYDSSEKIINAISTYNTRDIDENNFKEIIPDLLIADESHNLVSENNKIKIAKYLLEESEEKKFNPNKYLFMTATPLKVIKRDRTSTFNNDEIIFSMNNENIYGKVFFEYTFYEGIHNHPQCVLDFDVIYLDDFETQDDNIKELINDLKKFTKEEQQQIYFETISQILLKIINKYNLKRVLIYLSNQTKVNMMYDILDDIKNNEEIYRLISDQTSKEKKENKKGFEDSSTKTKILLSVDILNEGVDIPIVDSVFFAEERNSETVIVQNIGRALRLNKSKSKAYVILPTKIYTLDNSDENAYSSKFKKIREICDILREPPEINNPKYYTRKTKGDNPSFTNDNEDEEINEKSGLVDKIVYVDNLEQIKINDSIIELKDLNIYSNAIANTFEIKSSNDRISNIDLERLKKIVQDEKIKNLYEMATFLESKCIITDKPHQHYKNNWICYGDFLFNEICTYNEAIEIIKSIDLTNIQTPKQWQEYYNNLIENELKNNKNDKKLDKIFFIPYDPKTYYLEEWNNSNENDEMSGWDKFLGKNLESTTGIEVNSKKSSATINAENNLTNLLNGDKEKVQKIKLNEFETFNDYKTDLSYLKEFIKYQFDIVDCIIEVRFQLNNLYALKTKIINIKLPNFPKNIVPITIDFNKKIKYDEEIYDKPKLINKKDKANRNKELNISNKEVQKVIDELLKELNEYVSNIRKNINTTNII